jgi:hypothetical protein
MNTKRLTGIVILIFIFIIGCSGTNVKLKTQSKSESRVTQQELIDNWSDYDIRYRRAALVFDPKNDDRKILLGGKRGWWWTTIEDQESWTEFVNTNMTSQGDFRPLVAAYPMTGVREIWGPDNQLYGFVVHQQRDIVTPELVEKNTMRLRITHALQGGP